MSAQGLGMMAADMPDAGTCSTCGICGTCGNHSTPGTQVQP